MKCKVCGGEVPSNASVCPYCDSELLKEQVVETTENENAVVETSNTQDVRPTNEQVFLFRSTHGQNIMGFLSSYINTEVTLSDDRMFIATKPKRFAPVPVILYEDITAVTITKYMNLYHILWVLITGLAGFATGWAFILTVLFIIGGLGTKIKISQRNGKDVVIYSREFKQGEALKASLKRVTKII